MTAHSQHDTDFMSGFNAARRRRPSLISNLLLLGIVGFVVWAVIWSNYAELEQVTAGTGQVIPSGQVQVVQNLEGGILAELLVKEGDKVEKDQKILRLDDTLAGSTFREDRTKYAGLLAQVARLTAEVDDAEPTFPKELHEKYPRFVKSELDLYRSNRTELAAAVSVLEQQVNQKKQELIEIASRINNLNRSLRLAREELAIIQPLYNRGVTSKVELLRIQREVNDIAGNYKAARESLPRAQAVLEETLQKIAETKANYRSRALKELNEASVNANAIRESLAGKSDRVRRTDVRAPVAGTIKRILVNTVGGVIKPGADLVEIVPREDNLLVEAKIRPQDIAFLHPGQASKVKVTAYDYTIYGTMSAKLEHISADTIVDQDGNSFYLIRVRTEDQVLTDKLGKPLPIIPGMTAEVDIITGKRSVLEYLLKPLRRAKGKALREP